MLHERKAILVGFTEQHAASIELPGIKEYGTGGDMFSAVSQYAGSTPHLRTVSVAQMAMLWFVKASFACSDPGRGRQQTSGDRLIGTHCV